VETRADSGVTLIQERRRDGDFIAGFLVIAFGAAAVSGASGAPVMAAVMGLLALGTAAGWWMWRRAPLTQLTVTADSVSFGRPDRIVSTIPRSAAPLQFRRNAIRQTGFWLVSRDSEAAPGISLIGFDPGAVREACEQHGWDFA
jgi:hypothetical protein